VCKDSEASEDSKAFVDSEPLREAIKLLLEHGASVPMENNWGETPFQLAAVRGLHEITGPLSIYSMFRASERYYGIYEYFLPRRSYLCLT
jgi:hypothetical protein